MQLVRGQTVERFHDLLVRHGERFLDRLALDHLGGHGARSDGAAAAERFKLHVLDDVVLDLQIHLHNIAAFGVADLADAVRIGDLADVAGIFEMIHYLIAVKSHDACLLLSQSMNCFLPDVRSFQTGDMLRRYSTTRGISRSI